LDMFRLEMWQVAVVLSVRVKVSPFTSPAAEAEKVGLAAP